MAKKNLGINVWFHDVEGNLIDPVMPTGNVFVNFKGSKEFFEKSNTKRLFNFNTVEELKECIADLQTKSGANSFHIQLAPNAVSCLTF